jgi:hypothetical protein
MDWETFLKSFTDSYGTQGGQFDYLSQADDYNEYLENPIKGSLSEFEERALRQYFDAIPDGQYWDSYFDASKTYPFDQRVDSDPTRGFLKNKAQNLEVPINSDDYYIVRSDKGFWGAHEGDYKGVKKNRYSTYLVHKDNLKDAQSYLKSQLPDADTTIYKANSDSKMMPLMGTSDYGEVHMTKQELEKLSQSMPLDDYYKAGWPTAGGMSAAGSIYNANMIPQQYVDEGMSAVATGKSTRKLGGIKGMSSVIGAGFGKVADAAELALMSSPLGGQVKTPEEINAISYAAYRGGIQPEQQGYQVNSGQDLVNIPNYLSGGPMAPSSYEATNLWGSTFGGVPKHPWLRDQHYARQNAPLSKAQIDSYKEGGGTYTGY